MHYIQLNMAARALIFSLLFTYTWAQNVMLGCQKNSNLNIDCEQELRLTDCPSSGRIFSPKFPNSVDLDTIGTYKLRVISCPKTTIKLNLREEDFKLGFEYNSFLVGDGEKFNYNESIIPPKLESDRNDDNCFPDDKPVQDYTSSNNILWIQADLLGGECNFVFNYTVITPNLLQYEYNTTEGNFSSPNFNGTNYPSSQLEEQHIVDVSKAKGEYVDLLFKVQEFDLNGLRGDHMKIGQGVDVLNLKEATVFSWKLPKGYQFLIDGPRANFVFKFFAPIEDDNSTHSGYLISYETIEKNLTTPSPTTTPAPTSPTPLPFDPEILETSLVFYDYVSNSSACNKLVDVLSKYAESSNMLIDGEIVPKLSEAVIEITKRDVCFHGWNVNLKTCVWASVIVEAFYRTNDSVDYAFPRDKIELAVRQFGAEEGIALPISLINVYWVSVAVAVCIIAIILLLLLFVWREKIRREYNRRKEYLRESGSSFGVGDGFNKSAGDMAFVNKSFVYDEDDDHFGGPTYDPDKLKHVTRSSHYGTSAPPSRGHVERSNSLKWKPGTPRGSLEINKNIAQQNAPIRGILKSNQISPDNAQTPSIVTLMDEPDDEVLFDTHSMQKPTNVPLQPVTNSSYNQQDLRGVVLENFDIEDFGETNL